jgi:hypothetical protein
MLRTFFVMVWPAQAALRDERKLEEFAALAFPRLAGRLVRQICFRWCKKDARFASLANNT